MKWRWTTCTMSSSFLSFIHLLTLRQRHKSLNLKRLDIKWRKLEFRLHFVMRKELDTYPPCMACCSRTFIIISFGNGMVDKRNVVRVKKFENSRPSKFRQKWKKLEFCPIWTCAIEILLYLAINSCIPEFFRGQMIGIAIVPESVTEYGFLLAKMYC